MDQELIKTILESDLEETARFYGLDKEEIIFQHDRDPKHTARSVKKWLDDNNWEVLPWPAQSPDLNPIENLWYQVKCALARYPTQARSCAELWDRFQLEWNQVTTEQCLNLISSMPRRLQAVIDAKGGPTKYLTKLFKSFFLSIPFLHYSIKTIFTHNKIITKTVQVFFKRMFCSKYKSDNILLYISR